ncbi:MAG: TRAM domain-containing protein, partial [Acholeplasmataceae bacterium]|nr:TRAM domain-containing protein [Acholeplasmataceae bacterium]
MNEHIKINDLLNITIRRMGINGEGIGYFHKLAIFVEQALPEEELEIEVQEVYDNRAIAKIKRIIKKHPLRRDPFCPVYEACGGCQTQHLDYQESLVQKREILIKSFERYVKTKLDHNLIKETIGSKNPMHYRNKAALPVRKINGKNQIGMYARGSNHFVEIDSC